MKRLLMLLFVSGALASCHTHDDRETADHHHDAQRDDRPALSFTHWTDNSELFMELPALVRGQESACAAHVTKLRPFSPLASGRVSVVLRGPSGEERFESVAPTVPGIFRPVAKPTTTGLRRLLVEIQSGDLTATHDLGDITIYENVAAARHAVPEAAEPPGRIPFLKEQQWPIEFETTLVEEHALRPSLRVSGTIRPRADGEVTVSAPVAGRVSTNGGAFPQLGQRVTIHDPLGALAPRLESADLASLELAVNSGRLELQFAERERQRLEGLRGQGAVPERRVQDATHTAEEAQANFAAAQRRLDQFRRVEHNVGRAESTVPLRAPLSGTITAVYVAPGAFVEAGAVLFRVTDLTQLWLEAHVPAADLARLDSPRGASFIVEGSEHATELPPDALVTHARVIDPASQTLALLFGVENAGGHLPIGAFCRVLLITGEERRVLALPESAVVDDSGAFVVFVQSEGESFERRSVRLGARDRGLVEIVSGVQRAEHVVTRGAWSVKLAASSGAIPAHGHSH